MAACSCVVKLPRLILRLCTVMRARHLRVQESHSTPRNLDLTTALPLCRCPLSSAVLRLMDRRVKRRC